MLNFLLYIIIRIQNIVNVSRIDLPLNYYDFPSNSEYVQ